MKDIKGIIFDFNGTLFNDTKLHEIAWIEYSAKLRGTPFNDYELEHYMFGRSNNEIIEYAIGRKPTPEEVDKYAWEKEECYRQLVLKNPECIKLVNGAEEVLDYVKENNIPSTIATGSEINNVKFFIEIFKLDKWFDTSKIIYDDGKRLGKPHPDIYLEALKLLNLKPEETLVFEDSYSGICAANAAGIGTIIALNEKPETFKHKDKVSKVIKDFTEVDIKSLIKA